MLDVAISNRPYGGLPVGKPSVRFCSMARLIQYDQYAYLQFNGTFVFGCTLLDWPLVYFHRLP